jgi:hypothetical protein
MMREAGKILPIATQHAQLYSGGSGHQSCRVEREHHVGV